MAAWVKCTSPLGTTIFVNIDNAVTLAADKQNGLTRITFLGSDEEVLDVKETPEFLIQASDQLRR